MKPVILAEKPPQARTYAEALTPNKSHKGYIEIFPNSIFPNGAYLTWAIGHLVGLAEPKDYDIKWEKWDISTMPIKPKNFQYVVSKGKQEQFKIVKSLLKDASEIILATDADREGENIARSIIKLAKVENKPLKRLWINSLAIPKIQQGFKELKDAKDFYLSYIEAQTRQQGDWLVGMNASRLYTLLLQSKGIKHSFSVGRVQTPTLYMIYEREKEMENFKPKSFYELEGDVHHKKGQFKVKANVKVDKKEDAIEILTKNNILLDSSFDTKVSNVEQSVETESSPRLYTLSSIQPKANKLWKYSPSKVLEIVQQLYEKKLVTYPRTDTPYITDEEFKYLLSHVEEYQRVINQTFEIKNREAQTRYVNSKKVQEHYAIIPTEKIPTEDEVNKLTSEEKNIYFEIVRNTLAMFHGKYEYSKTIIEIKNNGLVFMTTGKIEISKGWKELYPSDKHEKNEESLPLVSVNDVVKLKVDIKEGKTKKPKRYTEGDLIPMMKNCGNKLDSEDQDILKESEGIGTEATRANIIETLKKQEYIEVKKNLVYVTGKGTILCDVVEGSLLSSPSMTAKWETFLKQIGKGERKQSSFLQGIEKLIDKMMEEIPMKISSSNLQQTIEKQETENYLGKCPTCQKGNIIDKGKFYGCNGYKEGCKQTFPKTLLEKNITETQMKKLLSKGRTDTIKGFSGKKSFNSYLTLEVVKETNINKFKFNLVK
ncbi:DNA topoisomerase 3 [Cytobacillus sp. FSL M8-0252]|uniref:type IA DNA topoisomerase n=1 Tax=Cytobacillus sp. FSL M8-0252 TaxID=2921621 RepID=UPI0030F6494C